MKCLTLWQPWASLVEIGAKQFETRSWETMYRGPLAIHASKKRTKELAGIAASMPFCMYLDHYDTLGYGAVLAIVRLTDCIRITADNAPQGDERAFGDYTPGRFMWKLEGVRMLEPVFCVGRQGLFNLPPAVEAAIAAQFIDGLPTS